MVKDGKSVEYNQSPWVHIDINKPPDICMEEMEKLFTIESQLIMQKEWWKLEKLSFGNHHNNWFKQELSINAKTSELQELHKIYSLQKYLSKIYALINYKASTIITLW